ncbi:MAG: hypothetical protein AAGM84_15235 [Pseudomonadota bacterium]
MTKLKNFAMIAAVSVAPAIAFADMPQSGSPQQSVINDPDEKVGLNSVDGTSIGGTNTGSPVQSIMDDPNETALDTLVPKGSMEGTTSGPPQQSVSEVPNETTDS